MALGTRPEAVKLAPVIFELRRIAGLETKVLVTGQHREQLDFALRTFGLQADDDLDVMVARQSLPDLASRMIPASADSIRTSRADYVVVQGDTLSAFCVTLSAFFERVPVAHVEAGLRSGVIDEPFPEEASRRLTDLLSDLDLAPTPIAAGNLLAEGKPRERIVVTGQTAVDAVRLAAGTGRLRDDWTGRRLVTITLHRRENWEILPQLAAALAAVAAEFPDHLFVYPMHMNPVVRDAVVPTLGSLPNVELTEPLDYPEMAALMGASDLVVTDSGGLIEEGVSLGVFVAIVRNVTERPEGIAAGMARLLGTDPAGVRTGVAELLRTEQRPSGAPRANPYGDGHAGERVARAIAWRLGLGDRPADWLPPAATWPSP